MKKVSIEDKIAQIVRQKNIKSKALEDNLTEGTSDVIKLPTSNDEIIEFKEEFFKEVIADVLKESTMEDIYSDELGECFNQVKVKGVKLYSHLKDNFEEELKVSNLQEQKNTIVKKLFNLNDNFIEQLITNKLSEEYKLLENTFIDVSKNKLSEDTTDIDEELAEEINFKAISYLTIKRLMENTYLKDYIINKEVVLKGVKELLITN